MKKLECHLSFDNTCCWMWTLSSIFVGFKILEEKGLLKVKSVSMDRNFRADGRYPDRMIVELKADGKTIAYDMSDGYQSINIPELFDSQLDRLDYYFKSSYDPNFAEKLRNHDKFLPLGIAYECSCDGNYFEKANINDALKNHRYKEFVFQILTKAKRQRLLNYKNFEGNEHFDNYKILFWSRLWNVHTTPEEILKVYSELDYDRAKEKAETQNRMFEDVNRQRIQCVQVLKKEDEGGIPRFIKKELHKCFVKGLARLYRCEIRRDICCGQSIYDGSACVCAGRKPAKGYQLS